MAESKIKLNFPPKFVLEWATKWAEGVKGESKQPLHARMAEDVVTLLRVAVDKVKEVKS